MIPTSGAAHREPWAIVLAGGEGARLRALTRRLAGDDRPKQFCRILDPDTLLEHTCRRVALTVPAERTLLVVNQAHEPYWAPLLADVPPERRVVEPLGRGTAAAILHALLRAQAAAPRASVGIFPCDHFVSDDAAFMAHVEAALDVVARRADLVVLLGVRPDAPEVDYGWIEPGEAIPALGGPLRRVHRFWEKPSALMARALFRSGGLWNSFVVVGAASALVHLIRHAVPELVARFAAIRGVLATEREGEAVRALYARLPSQDFSREVLAACPANLAVLPVTGVVWSDWGSPERVAATLRALHLAPAWAETWGRRPA